MQVPNYVTHLWTLCSSQCAFLSSSEPISLRVSSKAAEKGMMMAPGSFLSTYSLILSSLKKNHKMRDGLAKDPKLNGRYKRVLQCCQNISLAAASGGEDLSDYMIHPSHSIHGEWALFSPLISKSVPKKRDARTDSLIDK